MEVKKVSLNEVKDVMELNQPLNELIELWEWIKHSEEMIERVKGLKEDNEILKIVLGNKIFHEDCKRWFLRGNQTKEGGLTALKNYLETEMVRGVISRLERAYVQRDRNNNNKIDMIVYITRKRGLLLSKEKRFREKESENFQEIFSLIKEDMCPNDLSLIIFREFNNFDEH